MRESVFISLVTIAALVGCSRDETGQGPADANKGSAALASATLTPLAGVDDDQRTFKGNATFTKTSAGVDLYVELKFCKDRGTYLFHIEDSASCEQLKGEPWDGARGEIRQRAACYATAAGAAHKRRDDDAKPWTIGGAARSNLLGRVLVASDSESKRPVACGKITEVQSVDAGTLADAGGRAVGSNEPSLAIRAHVAGTCQADLLVHSGGSDCPDTAKWVQCATESCQLDSCLRACGNYIDCLESSSDDWCSSTCERSEECWTCMVSMFGCIFRFCEEVVSCAAPAAPNGPCRKVEACCRMQRKGVDACLDLLDRTERWSGDPSCAGLLEDDAFLHDLVNDPPCDELDL